MPAPLVTASLLGALAVATSGCCLSAQDALRRQSAIQAENDRAVERVLAGRGLTLVNPSYDDDVPDAPHEWSVRRTESGVLVLAARAPRTLVRDARGRLFAVRWVGAAGREELVICGCSPGHGIEQRPTTAVVEIPSEDTFGGTLELAARTTEVRVRHQRSSGPASEGCNAAP